MSMKVVPYERAMAGELTSAYNECIRGVPHCYPVGVEDFAVALAPAAGEGKSHERLHSEAAWAVTEGKAVLGFVHVGTERPEKKGEDEPARDEQGVIRFMVYRRGRRQAGQLLLAAAEDYCRQRGLKQLKAFTDYLYSFYYFPPVRFSDRLGHVRALLEFNGYEKCDGEVVLDWPDYQPVEPVPAGVPAEIAVKWEDGRGKRPNLTLKALQGTREIGWCDCFCAGEYSRAEEAQDWLFTTWLGVADDLHGRGLGRYLLQRALKQMHEIGYRHAVLSTDWRNHRAFLFYTNYGYRTVDWTYAFRRDLP
ncbi:MAG: hypothetical protein AMJ81_09860 [Phycisphaerae bacterium SM23_33]|nr:MAG: hypothetical protein AMJ81_09860 [Phycisphaerae bacterium SM23_33]